MHFGILKTTERTPRLVISPLVANRVGTDSAVLRYVHFTLALAPIHRTGACERPPEEAKKVLL